MKYERLGNEDQPRRRTAMDALEVLRNRVGFEDRNHAEFRVVRLPLLSGDIVGVPDLQFTDPVRDAIFCVGLPTATHFEAIPTELPVQRRYKIEKLNGALINGMGVVRCQDGTALQAVKIEPFRMPRTPSDEDWRIVHLTLELVGAKHCYRSIRESLPLEHQEMVPDLRSLDLTKVSGLTLPPLKDIADHIRSKYRDVSSQQVANSLRMFGIRLPVPRPG